MGEFKDLLKTRRRVKDSEKELKTIGEAIEQRGRKTIKLPYLSDKKTGEMMVTEKRLSKKVPKMAKIYRGRRNRLIGKTGGKALLAGAALYGGNKLIEHYDSSPEKYEKRAGYPGRVADSLSRLVNFGRGSSEIKRSATKAAKGITREIKKTTPDKN